MYHPLDAQYLTDFGPNTHSLTPHIPPDVLDFINYESLNANLRLVLLTQVSKCLRDPQDFHRILWECILFTVRLNFVVSIT